MRQLSIREGELHAAFKAAVLAKGDCVMAGPEACSGPRDPHHVIKQQIVRMKLLHLPEDERLRAEYDPRNGEPLCRFTHHDPVTKALRKLDRLQLSDRGEGLLAFVRDYGCGLEVALERAVPSLFARAAHGKVSG